MKICQTRPLPWYRPVVLPTPEEWVASLDDLLTQRLRHCLLCGAPCTGESLFGVWDLSNRRNVAYIMHDSCWRGGQATAAVREKLAQRYGVALQEDSLDGHQHRI
jgi:hypothetical protein